jgi:hypothetical protein
MVGMTRRLAVLGIVVLAVGTLCLLWGCSGTDTTEVQGATAGDTVSAAGIGNGMPSGPHYNLNIIGVKNSHDVGNSNGHTLFVKLNGGTRIYMSQNQDGSFEVTDRDGTDGVARFNIGDSNPTDARTHYLVFARGLGKPNGSVTITPGATFTDETATPNFYLDDVTIDRKKGKPQTVNVTGLFYVDVTIDPDGAGPLDPIAYNHSWIFDIPYLLEYWWDYVNNNLKLLQVRFYEGEWEGVQD